VRAGGRIHFRKQTLTLPFTCHAAENITPRGLSASLTILICSKIAFRFLIVQDLGQARMDPLIWKFPPKKAII
jgi:hypothetical protein